MRQILLVALAITLSSILSAQNDPFTRSWPGPIMPIETGDMPVTMHYTAINKVELNPGLTLTATGPQRMEVYLDDQLILPVDQMYTDFPDANQPYIINTQLPVGLIDGNANVDHNGASTYSLNIPLPTGVNGMSPTMGLSYNSNSPNGIIGLGWNLTGALSSITRVNRNFFQNGVVRSVDLSADDELQMDGSPLILIYGIHGANGAIYTPENDPTSQVIIHGDTENTKWLEVRYQDGRIAEYGRSSSSANSRFESEDNGSTLVWSLSKVIDQHGNFMLYEYEQDDRSQRLSKIKYTGNDTAGLAPSSEVCLIYGERDDVIEYFIKGNKATTPYLLSAIQIKVNSSLHSTYRFEYAFNRYSFLTKIHRGGIDGTELNPLRFYYGEEANSEELVTDYAEGTGNTVLAGTMDFNNDGFSDLFRFTGNSSDQLTDWEILTSNGSGNFTEYATGPLTSSLLPVDFNGDGHIDLVKIGLVDEGDNLLTPNLDNCSDYDVALYNSGSTNLGCITYDALLKLKKVDVLISNQDGTFTEMELLNLDVAESCYPEKFSFPGDFNGNGRSDLLIAYGNDGTNTTPCSTVKIITYDFDIDGPEIQSVDASLLGNVSMCEKVDLLDYNGNGKMDLLMIPNEDLDPEFQETIIIEIEHDQGLAWDVNTLCAIPTTDDFLKPDLDTYKATDLTADGKTDFLFLDQETDLWMIAVSDGLDFRIREFQELNTASNGCDLTIRHIGDLDADGIADILFEYFSNSNDCSVPEVGVLYGSGHTFSFQADIPFEFPEETYFGDFNGDGATDWLTPQTLASLPWDQTTMHRSSMKNLLHHVDNSYGVRVSFEYLYNTDQDFLKSNVIDPSIANGKQTGDPNSIRAFSNPMRAVRRFHYPIISGGTSFTEYRYTHPVAHTQGKGFLGFRWRTSYDHNTNVKTQDNFSINNYSENFELTSSYSAKFQDISNATLDRPIAETIVQEYLSGYAPGIIHSYDKRTPRRTYDLPKTVFVHEYNAQSSSKVENLYQQVPDLNGYGLFLGYRTKETTSRTGSINFNLGSEIETVVVTNDYNSESSEWWAPYVITGVSTSSIRHTLQAGMSHEESIAFQYDDQTGSLLLERKNPSTPFEVTTEYLDYNDVGLSERIRTTSAGLNDVEALIEYDPSFKFVQSTTDDLGQTSTSEYHNVFGALEISVDHQGLTDIVEFDEFGRVSRNINPLGLTTDLIRSWVNSSPSSQPQDHLSSSDILYQETVTTPESPDAVTQYDKYGNARISISQDALGQPVHTCAFFDDEGRSTRISEPFYPGQSPILFNVSVFMDDYDRVTSTWVQDQNGTIVTTPSTYTYDISDEGWVTGTANKPDGTSSTTYTDGTGKIVKIEEEGGTLIYDYYSDHNLRSVEINGQLASLMTYDHNGNRTSLHDPNSNTVVHAFDAYNRPLYQMDARNNRYEYTYDANDGRALEKKFFPDWNEGNPIQQGSYVYQYVTQGNGLNNVESISSPDGMTTAYTYDSYGRIEAKSEIIDAEQFTTTTSYDSFGRVNNIIHPGNIQIDYHYTDLGFLYQMSHDGLDLWTIGDVNARGQITQYNYGNGITTTEEFSDLGLATHKYTSDGFAQDYSYQFDPNSGNLDWRKDNLANRKEDFTYDALNRLTRFDVLDATTDLPVLDLASFNYAQNGNLTSSSVVGQYSYDPIKTHAVSSVQDPSNVISASTQTIGYNGFNSIDQISELIGTELYSQEYFYGADSQRRKVVNEIDDVESSTVVYANAFERKSTLTSEVGVLYINTPTGASVMFVTEDGQTEIKYAHTDHLGSIIAITDANGAVEAKQSFDAWGRHRSPDDWTYLDIDPQLDGSLPNFLWRGFTGHEHMAEYGLINMNGRIYDPLLGRMLSPDNHVQVPSDTQSYNKYSYARNNPLKYTDPDGEFIFASFVISSIVIGILDHIYGVPPSQTFTTIVMTALNLAFSPGATIVSNLGLGAVLGAAKSAGDPNTSFAQGIGGGLLQSGISAGLSALPINNLTANIKRGIVKEITQRSISAFVSSVVGAAQSGGGIVRGLIRNMAMSLAALASYDFENAWQNDPNDPSYNLLADVDPTKIYAYQEAVVIVGKMPFFTKFLNVFQTAMDVAGLVPGFGEVADGINAVIYLARGDYTNAALSAAAMVPFVGAGATVAKMSMAAATVVVKSGRAAGRAKKSINQLNNLLKTGKGPKSIKRFDKGKDVNQAVDHVHFKDGGALRADGVWRHGPERPLTNKEFSFLYDNGWNL